MDDVRHLAGREVQGWLIEKDVLGSGADGIVYLGRKDNQPAAVKIFFPEAVEKNGYENSLNRMELQLTLKGEKKHPNLVRIIDGGPAPELGKTMFLVMEHINGTSLDRLIGSIPTCKVATLVSQLACVARYMESIGLVHRDIKPANIVVSKDLSLLTLLDIGIAMTISTGDDGRLSGKEFVSTLRYSPPEFVYRQEEGSSDEAWRAITFYQIGATLHDMIMGRPLFDGFDKPHGVLYESVRYQPPDIKHDTCPQWLLDLAKCCLVKNWRERLQLVTWESFLGPPVEDADMKHRMNLIKLRQIRSEELAVAIKVKNSRGANDARVRALWDLHDKLFMEIRSFLMNTPIFPRFSGIHNKITDRQYELRFEFEVDQKLCFPKRTTAQIFLSIDDQYEIATQLRLNISLEDGEVIADAVWTEMLTVETAFSLIRQSLIQAADKVVPTA